MSKLKWTVEFYVDKSWVAEGFEMTDGCAFDMLAGELPWATDVELDAKVIQRPDQRTIDELQGKVNV
jgi:hypothetical protein